jgi:hypothetical protein
METGRNEEENGPVLRSACGTRSLLGIKYWSKTHNIVSASTHPNPHVILVEDSRDHLVPATFANATFFFLISYIIDN